MSLFLAVAIKFTEEHLVDRPEEALDAATALRLPGVENTSRILRSTATCSMCFEVKSDPLSV
jgi:hypothetical protein